MPMVFTLVSVLRDWISDQLTAKMQEAAAEAKLRAMKLQEEQEKEEQKRFEGTPVTTETFLAWKSAFDKEMKALAEKNAKLAGEDVAKGKKKLTGRQLFEQDKSLVASDAIPDEGDSRKKDLPVY